MRVFSDIFMHEYAYQINQKFILWLLFWTYVCVNVLVSVHIFIYKYIYKRSSNENHEQ